MKNREKARKKRVTENEEKGHKIRDSGRSFN
jgi:hypothetical protein